MVAFEVKDAKNRCYYYSINSRLAYYINNHYYKGRHYVWCAPKFDAINNPPSSNPKRIYSLFLEDVKCKDNHSLKIKNNRLGLLKGVEIMLKEGVINKEDRDELVLIINEADLTYFSPLIYIIDSEKVKDQVVFVEPRERANLFSEEGIIQNLNIEEFDVIEVD